ncbi:hypothetical protein AB1K62_13775 [Parasphingorhabdus sp. JC815]|uniref:hypothetical protein n=1 Tax=Parasphingorhabdus sp. JC815 TaxID=3232140 RepID=UPI00345798F5
MKAGAAFSAALLLAGCSPVQIAAQPETATVKPAAQPAISGRDHQSPLDRIAIDYILLTLAMGEKEAGYVDAYYGPEIWQEQAKQDGRSLAELGQDITRLIARTKALSGDRNRARQRFLLAQLEAARTRHAMLSGKTLPFVEEAKGLFGVSPAIRPLTEFDPVLAKIDRLVPGEGDLAARVEAFEDQYIIPKERLKTVFDTAIAECKRRTEKYFDLPSDENFRMEFVTGKSWSGYNYYQGKYQSLIQINTDLPIRISRAVDLGCHEGYPGHHVYNMLLEENLANQLGWKEFSVYPLYSPQSLIAEGSANYGIRLAFPGHERLQYERDVLYPLAGLNPEGAQDYWALQNAKDALSGARITIAQQYLDGEISREQAAQLIRKYQLVSADRARQLLDFNDQYRSYVINYGLGQDMVREWIEAQGDAPVWRWKAMERLLSEPMLPQDLQNGLDEVTSGY